MKQKPDVVQTGDPVLRVRAKEVEPERITTPEMQALVKSMIETMRTAPGVGLAAPQVGVPLRLIVLEDSQKLASNLSDEEREARGRVPFPTRTIFNPVLTTIGDERVTFFEGCLSVHGFVALVERAVEVEVTGLDETAQAVRWRVRGWPARILQHEVDHINGGLYIDRMISRTFATAEHAGHFYARKTIEEIRASLNV
jgi:peptide deformylase